MELWHIRPPEKLRLGRLTRPTVFLGGAIDNGAVEDWQATLVEDYQNEKLAFLNPRRENWNPNSNENEVREQIYWELDGLEGADSIIIYFHALSKAPISLLEFGLFARHKKVVVVCPPGYWRRINVEVTASRMGVQLYDNLEDGMAAAVELARYNFETYGGLRGAIRATK